MDFAKNSVAGFMLAGGLVALTSALGCSSQEHMREEHPKMPETLGQAMRTIELTAPVVAVDTAERRMTLRAPNGQDVTFDVSPSVSGLERIKPGDSIKTTYHEAIVLSLRKAGDEGATVETSQTAKPLPQGFEVGRRVTAMGEIVEVNHTNNSITFRGPQGVLRTIGVFDPFYQKRLNDLHAGDKVELTYTESIIVALEPAQAPSAQL